MIAKMYKISDAGAQAPKGESVTVVVQIVVVVASGEGDNRDGTCFCCLLFVYRC